MNQAEFTKYVIDTLERLNVAYAVVGSVASMAYGEPRATQDLVIVVDLPESAVGELCAAFAASEFYVSEAAALDAVRRRRQFNVIHSPSAFKVDFMLVKNTAWGRTQLSRRRRELLVGDLSAYTAAPEDIILGKLQYYREGESPKHPRDIKAMLQTIGDEIDRENVTHWAEQLGVLDLWLSILADVDRPDVPQDDTSPF
jgi:hypothetical protein